MSKRVNTVEKMEVVKDIQTRILTLLSRRSSWDGTMTDLSRVLTKGIRRATPAVWPGSASILRRYVNKVVPALRRAGVKVEFSRTTDHSRTRIVSISKRA